jgi:hypothetical protein
MAIFRGPAEPDQAAHILLAKGLRIDQLLLLAPEQSDGRARPLISNSGAQIAICSFNPGRDDELEHVLARAIASVSPFSALWESLRGDRRRNAAVPKIYDQMRKRLTDGAVVLVAHVDGAEEQRCAAQALLDCPCEVVLTHELTVRPD